MDYVYRSTDGTFRPLPDPSVRPADLARTTTDAGRAVDYVVRVETGTINRAIYETAILHDPNVDGPVRPWSRPRGWNGRLVYSFGGSCAPGYQQGLFNPGAIQVAANVLNDAWLSQGYAVATLTVLGNNCNDVPSGETVMMVKERFIEGYGVPRHTIGWGASGGAIQQHLIAQNYPGLLDGITPARSFPDALTFFTPISDCGLLNRAFETSSLSWTTEQKTAVAGWPVEGFCTNPLSSGWAALLRAGPAPASRCSSVVPPSLIYDPVTNPGGARCTWFDNAVNIFGRDPVTGFARRALDNVGIQYGLTALDRGRISAEQFLELNERVGGYDIDGNIVTDPHDAVRSDVMRARLTATNGTAANQVILTAPNDDTAAGAAVTAAVEVELLRLMDAWLTNIERDRSPYRTSAEKVVRNRPRELVDACYSAAGDKVTDSGRCRSLYPVHANPRLVAGEPLTDDVLKCRLKPVRRSDYAQRLTAEQFARLQQVLPAGVCDYRRPGVGQGQLEDTWLAYPRPGTSVALDR